MSYPVESWIAIVLVSVTALAYCIGLLPVAAVYIASLFCWWVLLKVILDIAEDYREFLKLQEELKNS